MLDTNVLVSGVFFSGPPSRVLKAWRDGRLTLVYSAAIFEEYDRVFMELTDDFPRSMPDQSWTFLFSTAKSSKLQTSLSRRAAIRPTTSSSNVFWHQKPIG